MGTVENLFIDTSEQVDIKEPTNTVRIGFASMYMYYTYWEGLLYKDLNGEYHLLDKEGYDFLLNRSDVEEELTNGNS